MDTLTQTVFAFVIVAALIVTVTILSRIFIKRKREYSQQYLADHTEATNGFADDLRELKELACASGMLDEELRRRFASLADRIDHQVTEDMRNQLRGKLRTDEEFVVIDQKQKLVRMQLEINIILLKGFVY